jgi:hypothetical protein
MLRKGKPAMTQPVISDSGNLSVRRVSFFADRRRLYRVLVDGQKVGLLNDRDPLIVQVSPGPHNLCVKIDWCSSNTLRVDVKPGQRLVVECGSNVQDANWFLMIFYTTVKAHDYLWLREIAE